MLNILFLISTVVCGFPLRVHLKSRKTQTAILLDIWWTWLESHQKRTPRSAAYVSSFCTWQLCTLWYAHLSWCPRSCRSVSVYFCLSLGSTLASFFTSLRTKYQNSLTPFSTLLRSSSWVGPGPAAWMGGGGGWGVKENSSLLSISKINQIKAQVRSKVMNRWH